MRIHHRARSHSQRWKNLKNQPDPKTSDVISQETKICVLYFVEQTLFVCGTPRELSRFFLILLQGKTEIFKRKKLSLNRNHESKTELWVIPYNRGPEGTKLAGQLLLRFKYYPGEKMAPGTTFFAFSRFSICALNLPILWSYINRISLFRILQHPRCSGIAFLKHGCFPQTVRI